MAKPASRRWFLESCPPVHEIPLARSGGDEYDEIVLIWASFPRRPSASALPRRRDGSENGKTDT